MISGSLASSSPKHKVTRFVAASSQYVTMGNKYDFLRTDSWSVSCWAKKAAGGGNALVHKSLAAGTFAGWHLQWSGNVFWRIGFDAGGGRAEIRSTNTFSADQWIHIVVTYSGNSDVSGQKIYVNGALETPVTVANSLAGSISNAANFQIGARDGTDSFINADIQDVAIWNGVLTAGNVTSLYDNRSRRDVRDLGVGTPLSYWILGEHKGDTGTASGNTSGTNVPDLGSNAFAGTMTNTPTLVTRA